MKALILGSLAIAALACANAPVERSHYLLRATHAPEGAVESEAKVGLRRVEVADYLAQPGLVVQVGRDEVRAAKNHLWAEPLARGVRVYLRSALADALGEPVAVGRIAKEAGSVVIDVAIEEFHGRLDDGGATLVASYQISVQEQVTRYRYAATASLPEDGYSGLVAAEKELLTEFAAAIADSVRGALSNRTASS